MLNPPDVFVVRNEFVLRLFMLSTLDADDARALVAQLGEESAREVAKLRDAIDKADATSPSEAESPPGCLAAEYGARIFETTYEWALWAADRIDRSQRRRRRST
jgi:PadR family transcriptional regulator, regulatory protein AphA